VIASSFAAGTVEYTGAPEAFAEWLRAQAEYLKAWEGETPTVRILRRVAEELDAAFRRGKARFVSAPPEMHSVSTPALYDVAALGRRYNRAPATVRQWFHDGLFGPPEERLFRGRGYVASDDVIRDFELRTGLRPVSSGSSLTSLHVHEEPERDPSSPVLENDERRVRGRPSRVGTKIAAAAGAPGRRRVA
jgi:hypothetical protein